MSYRDYCEQIYDQVYEENYNELYERAAMHRRRRGQTEQDITEKKLGEIETASQKEAIKQATVRAIETYVDVEPANIWKAINAIHIHRKSGIDNLEIISAVVSADQSWKKSSGHAFEEVIKEYATQALQGSGIEIILQRDLSALIKARQISNHARDISWLKEHIKANIFDLYAVVEKYDDRTQSTKKYCFGCIQSKTSIRDRVTRDREPSIAAMQSFFWSVVVVLDGDFLRNPKFINMVNGNSQEFPENGWHGMYVLSESYSNDRIYGTNLDFEIFKEHAIQAANNWCEQRQWLDHEWRATL